MFWADELLGNRKGKELINDAWTPSGMVHMGSVKGPVLHDVVYRILKEQRKDVQFIFGFDDADPIDGLPPELKKSHEQYLGVPVHIAPSPDGKGSYADFYGNKLKIILDALEIKAEVYKMSEQYKNGMFNKAIAFILDHVEDVRNVYSEMYQKPMLSTWFPLQIICPNCGKLGTTKVVGWNGTEVDFSCEKSLVKWAQGCGASGTINPFNGNSKLPYKVEWAAKWWVYGVTIEGAGKDHASAGGSHDVAVELCKKVFKRKPPLKFTYEFFLSGGKKMSSSKGVGLNGDELLEVLPPQVTRFLMMKSPLQRAVEFSPHHTYLIPRLYEEYQTAAQAYFDKTDEHLARIFELSQVDGIKKPPAVRFSTLTQWVQMPNMAGMIKNEKAQDWAEYAKIWLEKYAPESEQFMVQEKLPDAARSLSEKQKAFLQKIAGELSKDWNQEEFQKQLYEWAKEFKLSSKEAFPALYVSLIGKDHGPKAGWLILSLDKEFVKNRLKEV